MYSSGLFIIIAFGICGVFCPYPTSNYSFSRFPTLQTGLCNARLRNNDFNGAYDHDVEVKPRDTIDVFGRGYQLFLRDETLRGIRYRNAKEYFCSYEYPSYQFKISELGPLYQEIPSRDVRQLVEEKRMAEERSRIGLGFMRQFLMGLPDQSDGQTFVMQDTPQPIYNENSTQSYLNPIWNPNPQSYQPARQPSFGGRSLFNRTSSSSFLRPSTSFNFRRGDTIPPQAQNPRSYSELQNVIDNARDVNTNRQPNGMMLQNNLSIPKGSKLITRNGQKCIAKMPEEIPVQAHSFEEPMGITLEDVRAIRNEVLNQVNMYRNRHGCNALTPNGHMDNHAQEWANNLAQRRTLAVRKPGENDIYGETVHASSGTNDIGKLAVDIWYNQLRFINVGDDDEALIKKTDPIRFLVQLLWQISKEIGVGVAKSAYGEYFIVANYNPKGNLYPFLLDNLPVFKQDDIDTAQKAHDALADKFVMKNVENNQIGQPVTRSGSFNQAGQPVTRSDSANKVNRSQNYTNDRPIAQSNDLNEMPKRIQIGPGLYALPPKFNEPKDYPDITPRNISRSEVEVIRQDVLVKTNYYRQQRYNLNPLVLNKQIDHYAQEWANYLASTNQFRHRTDDEDGKRYGENLYRSSPVRHPGEAAVDLWYYEISLIDANDNADQISNKPGAGHLTQLLWKASVQMGVGAAVSDSGNIVVAANYNPPGNSKYFYSYNLPKFTQEQIDEGRRLQAEVDKWKGVPVPVSMEDVMSGKAMKTAGWNSQLYGD